MQGLFPEPEPEVRLFKRYVRVAPETGLDRIEGLTYGVPDDLGDLAVGDRVVVPLGRGDRPVEGYVLDVSQTTDVPANRIKPIVERDRHAVRLPGDLIELARWVSSYYCCPLGMVLANMLPAAVKKATGLTQRRLVELADVAALQDQDQAKRYKLTAKQKAIMARAIEMDAAKKLPIDPRELAEQSGSKTTQPVRHVVDKGLLKWVEHEEVRASWHEPDADRGEFADPPRVELNDEQVHAVQRIAESLDRGFTAHLVHGVTGSGKTEVYIRLIERVVEAGGAALVLVPEIALTPQTTERFTARFDHVAVLHSGLTDAQRHEQYRLIQSGEAQVVIGARSAVFAPVANLKLIVVDEEADATYKQDQAPRYHARDVALQRANLLGATVVLGSATPALESFHNAQTRANWKLHRLTRRVSGLPMPPIDIVDMRDDRIKRYAWTGRGGQTVNLLSMRLETQLRETFDAGGQAILLLNRRGFANYIACANPNCDWLMTCDNCDVTMVYHLDVRVRTGGYVRCHHCSFANRMPDVCPVCSGEIVKFGLGTQRAELELGRKFPDIAMLRMDSDAMRTGRDYAEAFGRFRRGELRLLIGTQMVAHGLDFPNVKLVGILSADAPLHIPDFRSEERMFSMIVQVAGRTGRASADGRVIVQTYARENPVFDYAVRYDYDGFARQELELRGAMGLPPMTRMARIVLRDEDAEKAQAAAEQLVEHLTRTEAELKSGSTIDGPTAPPITRLAGYHRRQVLIVAPSAGRLQGLLSAARKAGRLISDAKMAVDVDPVSMA